MQNADACFCVEKNRQEHLIKEWELILKPLTTLEFIELLTTRDDWQVIANKILERLGE